MSIRVRKASGIVEEFDSNKLKQSLIRSGADKITAEEIVERILKETEPYTDTKKIYSLARKYLRRFNHASGIRYSLKRALFRLGPTGYPFEKYFGEILKNYGYEVEVGVIMEGRCIRHEIDVLATKDREITVVECKYHNSSGRSTDSKVALYVNSRFNDLRSVFENRYPDRKFSGWLVTNTRCTSDALQYAECAGFRIISWRYPSNESLQWLIESKRLYPVTIISGIKAGLIKSMIDRGIILLKDLAGMDVEKIQDLLGLPKTKAELLKRQADALCLC